MSVGQRSREGDQHDEPTRAGTAWRRRDIGYQIGQLDDLAPNKARHAAAMLMDAVARDPSTRVVALTLANYDDDPRKPIGIPEAREYIDTFAAALETICNGVGTLEALRLNAEVVPLIPALCGIDPAEGHTRH